MYEVLLDELEDDVTPHPDEIDLDDKVDEALGLDDDVADPDLELEAESESELGADEDLLSGGEDADSWSDDPVRMYLTQMGEIPLLTRLQEIGLAKAIEKTRAKFRRKVLECDYVMQTAFKVLHRVHAGDLPFDRTVQVSVTDRLEKDQILGRLPADLGNSSQAQSPRLPDLDQQAQSDG